MPSMRTTPDGDDVDVAGDERAQGFRHARFDLQPDDRAAAAPLQRALEKADEVFGLLLDLDVAVADDAETALPDDLVAGKKLADERQDDLLERDEALPARRAGLRQLDEAIDLAGNAHQRAHRAAVAAGSSVRARA